VGDGVVGAAEEATAEVGEEVEAEAFGGVDVVGFAWAVFVAGW
jgi:hypothetical protein